MKKIILVLILIVSLCSCNTGTERIDTQLPETIASRRDKNQFDTVLIIQDEQNIYYFTKERSYVKTIDRQAGASYGGLIFTLLLLLIFIICIFA